MKKVYNFMSKNILIFSAIFISVLLIFSAIFIFANTNKNKEIPSIKNNIHLGPVQEGYDEQYFRETGITRKINS